MKYDDLVKIAHQADEAKTITLCQNLIQTASISGDELPIAHLAAEYLAHAGLQVELIKHEPRRASVLAVLKGSGEKPALLFSAHMDTVSPGEARWQHNPFAAEIAEGKIWGRGASDMKSGMAALMCAAKTLADCGLPRKGDLYLALSAGEETGLIGARALIEPLTNKGIHAAIIAEPSANELVIAEKGALWVQLITHGKTAHGSMPECGHNAIVMMLELLRELQQSAFVHTPHPLLGNFTHSLNVISGGIGTNVVPDLCTAAVDMRTVPGQDHHQIITQIQRLFQNLEKRLPSFKADIRVLNNCPPLSIAEDNPFVQLIAQAAQTITAKAVQPRGVRFFSDGAALIPALQIPWVIIGPGPAELAHQPDEYVEIEKLVQATRIYTLSAAQYLL